MVATMMKLSRQPQVAPACKSTTLRRLNPGRLAPKTRRQPAACTNFSAAPSLQQHGWQLLAVFLSSLQLVLAGPTFADSSSFSGNVKEEEEQYFITVPQDLDSADKPQGPRLGSLIEGPKGKQVQQCARQCMPACLRGGQGAPGLGPMTVRKEIIVFKEGFHSRKYCLSECTQVCALEVNAK